MNEIFIAEHKDTVRSRIMIEQWDKRYIVESPYSDGANIEDLLDMVYGILLNMGYHQDTINQALVEMANEKGYKEETEEGEE